MGGFNQGEKLDINSGLRFIHNWVKVHPQLSRGMMVCNWCVQTLLPLGPRLDLWWFPPHMGKRDGVRVWGELSIGHTLTPPPPSL
jgi:hypothetical protein